MLTECNNGTIQKWPIRVNTTIDLKNMTTVSENIDIQRRMFRLTSVPASWEAVVTFFSSVIGLTPNGSFWIAFSERYVIVVRTNSITTEYLYLTFKGTGNFTYVT